MLIQLFRHNCSVSGAIFTQEDKDSTTEVAFKYAVYRINKDKAILPNTTLVYDIEYVSPQDSFKASKKGMALWLIQFVNYFCFKCILKQILY